MIKKISLVILVLILGIFIVSSLENKNKIDSEIYKNLEKNLETKVIIEIKDSSISAEKENIKEDIMKTVGKDDVRHIFDKEIAVDVSREELIKLNNNPDVKSIVVDKPVRAFLQDSVPLINATSAWSIKISNINITGIDKTICILDSGINFTHPDLIGKNKTCIIDCINKACIENCSVADDYGHGTHVAGIAAASGGLNGVAIGANLIGVKVLNSAGSGSISDIDAGLDWCISNSEIYNISVISMSLGTDCDTYPQYCYSYYCDDDWNTTAQRINNATSKNISVIIASGNDGNSQKISAPSCVYNATSVSATNKDDTFASYSNRNNITDLIAPGTSITSTKNIGGYEARSGTSMATPHVAGAFAIIRQFFRLQNLRVPTSLEILSILNSTGKQINDTGGNGLNYSRINIYSAIISMDVLNPEVNLLSPQNATNYFGSSINFSCSANNVRLSNITLYIWNSTSIYNKSEINYVSGTSATVNFNISHILSGDYTWNCLAYDSNGNYSFASANFSFYIRDLSVELISPLNNSYTNLNSVDFNCSAESETTKRLKNITFYLWNSSSLIFNSTKNISGILNSSIFNYSFQNNKSYHWNCISSNNVSSNNFANQNFTITYDSTKPEINLIGPVDSTYGDSPISFNYNVSDNFNVANCSLILNNAVSMINNSIVNLSAVQNFIQTLSAGSYSWSVNCSDYAGNIGNSSQRTFNVNSPAQQIIVSTGGGGGSTPLYSTYSITYKQGSIGYTKNLGKEDRIKFVFFDKKSGEHSLIVNEIKQNLVNITIKSSSINLILGIGQSAKLNLSSSGYYDLLIKLDSIENNKAKLTIQLINEKIIDGAQKEIVNHIQEVENPEINKKQELTEFELKKLKNVIFILVIIFIILALVILIAINKNNKNKKDIKAYNAAFKREIKPVRKKII
jgi:subtilisin family serine protease